MIYKTGDKVTIECDGRTLPGTVMLASSNGISLMLSFDALLDGHAGMMPVVRDPDDASIFYSIMTGIKVIVRSV